MNRIESFLKITDVPRWRWTWTAWVLVILGNVLCKQSFQVTEGNPAGWWAYVLPTFFALVICGRLFTYLGKFVGWSFKGYHGKFSAGHVVWYVIVFFCYVVAVGFYVDIFPWLPGMDGSSAPKSPLDISFVPFIVLIFESIGLGVMIIHLLWVLTGFVGIPAINAVINYNNAK